MNRKIYIIAITGASGSIYAIYLINELLKLGYYIHLIITEAGWQVLKEELGWETNDKLLTIKNHFNLYNNIIYHDLYDFSAAIASGSYKTDGMIIIPSSMGTLARIAMGTSSNLLERAADVMIKEKRPLFIVPREMPLSILHLENMLKLAKMGVTIIPAMPGFYHNPKSIEDLILFVVGKILDSLNIEHSLFARWGDVEFDNKNR